MGITYTFVVIIMVMKRINRSLMAPIVFICDMLKNLGSIHFFKFLDSLQLIALIVGFIGY